MEEFYIPNESDVKTFMRNESKKRKSDVTFIFDDLFGYDIIKFETAQDILCMYDYHNIVKYFVTNGNVEKVYIMINNTQGHLANSDYKKILKTASKIKDIYPQMFTLCLYIFIGVFYDRESYIEMDYPTNDKLIKIIQYIDNISSYIQNDPNVYVIRTNGYWIYTHEWNTYEQYGQYVLYYNGFVDIILKNFPDLKSYVNKIYNDWDKL